MEPNYVRNARQIAAAILPRLRTAFDVTATWVTQMSWWKFLLFALLLIIGGGLVQDTLFSSKSNERVIVIDKKHGPHSKLSRLHSGPQEHELTTDDGTSIRIDGEGLHITRNPARAAVPASAAADDAIRAADPDTPPTAAAIAAAKDATPAGDGAPTAETTPSAPLPPTAPAASKAPSKMASKDVAAPSASSELHISMPPEIGAELRDALDEAVDEAAQDRVTIAQRKSSEWFMNFVLLLIVGLFGTKALMGGKKRAEAQAQAANAAADRETLQRQITEAKMQVMQAQVEPHFLFNTLASVEHLIETDPPRASAMQRSLIQYLRAVLPQIRDNASSTTLGREAGMVRAYLDLLKMRMEERLHVDFQIPDGLRSAAFPPMMLQSLVENAIKHGLECKAEGGTLKVMAEVVDNRLRVTVSDDGLGFGAVPSDSTGLGLQSIRERLKLLYGNAAQLEISANQPSGVRAAIDVPYQLANTTTR